MTSDKSSTGADTADLRGALSVILVTAVLLSGCMSHSPVPGSTLSDQAPYWNPEDAVRHYDRRSADQSDLDVSITKENSASLDAFRFPRAGEIRRPAGVVVPAVSAIEKKPLLIPATFTTAAREKPALLVSPGDRIRVTVPEGDEFSGVFEVDFDGRLKVPYMDAIPVTGLPLEIVQEALAEGLVRHDLFQPDTARVSIEVQQWAPVQISVAGAVFNPGRVLINNRDPEMRAQITQDGGDFAPERYLSAALRAAGGVRPDAAVNSVVLIRGGQSRILDLSGAVTGAWFEDVVLISGDQLVVPSSGQFKNALVQPSAITPPGIRVFLSNLTIPAQNNTGSAIGQDSTRLPYGMRFLAGLAAANCIGGTRPTNADRSAVLITTNPVTRETQVVERAIEDLVRNGNRDAFNPYLMPNDAIACYDSNVTDLRDIARSLGDMLSPFSLLLGLF